MFLIWVTYCELQVSVVGDPHSVSIHFWVNDGHKLTGRKVDNLARVEVLYEENNLSPVNNSMSRTLATLSARYSSSVWIKNANNIFDGIGYIILSINGKKVPLYKTNVNKNQICFSKNDTLTKQFGIVSTWGRINDITSKSSPQGNLSLGFLHFTRVMKKWVGSTVELPFLM